MWGVSLTRPLLFYVGSFSYTPLAVICGEFLLHALCSFMWGVSLTSPFLFDVGSFSYMPLAVLCGEFLFHAPCCFMWGVSLTHPLLFYVGSFSYTPLAVLCGEILEHGPCYFMWGISLTQSVLIYVGLSPTLLALIFMEEVCFPCPMLFDIRNFVLHTLWKFMWGGFLIVSSVFIRVKNFFFILPILFYVGNLSYNCTCLVLVSLGSFSCTLSASLFVQFLLQVLCCFMREFLLHAPCCFMWGFV